MVESNDIQGRSEEIQNLIAADKVLESNRVGDRLQCVVLNACYTSELAERIAQHVPCVVGTAKAIGDEAAITFAAGFYRALGYGESVQTAFAFSTNEVGLLNLGEEHTPELLVRDGVDAAAVSFVSSE